MVWGLLLALLLIVTVALATPGDDGVKPTITEHFPFGPTGPLQVVVPENSLEPAMLPPPKVTEAPPFFFAVLVSVAPLTLLLPTRTVPKLKKLLETCTSAGTLGVGVGVGVEVGVGVRVGVGVWVGVGVEVGEGVGAGDGVGLEPAYAITKLLISTVPQPVTRS
jgi:hypothetical protein